MSEISPHHRRSSRSHLREIVLFLCVTGCALAAFGVVAAGGALAHTGGLTGTAGPTRTGALAQGGPVARTPYPGAVSRPLSKARQRAIAHGARSHSSRARKKARKPVLHGNPARAQRAFEAMQRYYYIRGSGLYAGEPFSFLWPFSQALAATVTMANVPAVKGAYTKEIDARLIGLQSYLDTTNSGAPEGTYTSTLAAYDGTTAPPTGPGGAKYYDDNDWVGIELMRIYKQTRSAAALGAAEGIMAFEMAAWQTSPELACPGGIPFSNAAENTERNTVTDAPAAELGVQLYQATGNVQYVNFAEMAYEWVRRCLLQPSGLYADHVNSKGVVEPTLWSYNQGTMIGAGTLLYQVTGNGAFLFQARQTAAAALAYFNPQRLAEEIPFFPSVYFRNLLYLDSVTHDRPGPALAQAYVNYAWEHLRTTANVFVSGTPPSAQLLVQAAITQIYALLSSPPSTYF